jgi:very-short-patch-repair endonuclease
MSKIGNPSLTPNSKRLRRNMTKEERHLWYDFLKNLPVTVNRQKVIGPYIVDFYCAAAKVVIELDGSQHYEETGKAADMERDAYLQSLGLTVLRYSNREVNQRFRGVCEDILKYLHG